MGEPRRLAPSVRLFLALPILFVSWLYLGSPRAHDVPERLLFGATYAVSVLVLFRRVLRGELLDPAVCLVGSYLLLLALGSLLFDILRPRSLSPWAFNAIGVGHAALWTGCGLAGKPRPRALHERTGIASRYGVELLLFGIGICLMACVALFASFGSVPLLAADPDEARLAILAGRGELAIFLVGLGLLAYAFRYDACVRGGRPWPAHALCALNFVVLLSLGGRARTLLFLLGYAGLDLMLRPRELRAAVLLVGTVLAVGMLAIVGAWRRGGSLAPEASLAELGIGALALPTMVARLEQRIEPGTLGGGPLSDLATLVPGEDHGANVDLKYAVFDNWRNMPASAGVNPSLIGEGYIQHGAAGVVLEPFLLGLLSALLYRRGVHARSFLGLALYVCWITGMMAAISAGVGIRLTHFVQQLAWILVLAPFFFVRTRGAAGSNRHLAVARVSELS